MAPYNFLDSQRPDVILLESEIQTPADTTISKCFQDTSFMVTKMTVGFRKLRIERPPFVEQLPHVGDITLRRNHYTNHVKLNVGAPQGIEIAPANEFHEFRGLNPSPASIFLKIS